jgi:hypothetical protein
MDEESKAPKNLNDIRRATKLGRTDLGASCLHPEIAL